jgi:hypothetical protein
MYSQIYKTPSFIMNTHSLAGPSFKSSFVSIPTYKFTNNNVLQTITQFKKSFNPKNSKLTNNLSDIQEIDLD